ncbi:hypothetical protein K2Z83_18765 [Oscillochloris sp. ZM17-4]|uniref:Cas10/Cmr2 second palm domain-containing protein n=1 Tax=Oscillochloris sp. ZM17-4 TaxID=2866714 RepID=UPI001C72D769|nr:hypothetical protein [Oscillochloris sp. ZM17-4]MBX0329717.1 hypothetical protein [Oscillochloris sp. ZM17-4]
MNQSLVAFDTDRIKDYVFASDALRDIRGASSILDQLNRVQLPGLVGADAQEAYTAGGSALFALPSDQAEAAIARVRQAYAEASGGAATITGVELPLPDGFNLQTDDIRPLWRLLGDRLAAAKSRNPPYLASVSHPLIRYDAVDDARYAAVFDQAEGTLISEVSRLKRARNRAIRSEADARREPIPESFEEIAASSRPQGYFALVVADGDGMGKVLEACRTFPEIGATARTLYEIIRETTIAATRDLKSHEFDRLILGGDDIVLAVPAQHGIPAALTLVEQFAQLSNQKLGRDLTLSAAVVWAHQRYPFAVWRELAESALRFAKREGALRTPSGGLINFLAVSSANHLAFEAFHRSVLTTHESESRRIVRTLRPYTPALLRELVRYRSDILRDVPRSKLAALNQAVFQPSYRQAMLDSLKILVHWRGERSRRAVVACVQDLGGVRERNISFPFAITRETDPEVGGERETYRTPLADLAEIWDFLPGDADAA